MTTTTSRRLASRATATPASRPSVPSWVPARVASASRAVRSLVALAGFVLVGLLAAPASHADVSWLCHPGIAAAQDPCETPLDTTRVTADEARSTFTPSRPAQADRPVDCFYVYPTVSNQPTPYATKARDPEVVSETTYQAARFSSTCRMFAPLYRQATVAGIALNGVPGGLNMPYADVLEAFRSYLAHDNDGRGIILIGHSQGSLVLRQLIRTQIDPDPALRSRLVGAFLLGGQVTTRAGQSTGGDFQDIPVCTRPGEPGCVVAYSTFPTDPGATSLYGNSNSDLLSGAFGEPHGAGYAVACTDPGTLSGDDGPFALTVPTKPFAAGFIASATSATTGTVPSASTTWVAANAYRGACRTVNGANVYRYSPVAPSPATMEFPPGFGTHLLDFQLGPDRLVRIASEQARSWLTQQPLPPAPGTAGAAAGASASQASPAAPTTPTGSTATPATSVIAGGSPACMSRRRFTVTLRPRLRRAQVDIGSRRVAVRRTHGRLTATIDLRGRPRIPVTVHIRATTRSGAMVRTTRKYRPCTARTSKRS